MPAATFKQDVAGRFYRAECRGGFSRTTSTRPFELTDLSGREYSDPTIWTAALLGVVHRMGARVISKIESTGDKSGGLLLNSRQVRARLGQISTMALWRWRKDPCLCFPQALIINKRNYWRSGELTSWVDDQGRLPPAVPDDDPSMGAGSLPIVPEIVSALGVTQLSEAHSVANDRRGFQDAQKGDVPSSVTQQMPSHAPGRLTTSGARPATTSKPVFRERPQK